MIEGSLPAWLSIEDPDRIGQERLAEAVRAAYDWDDHYGCDRPVTLRPFQSFLRQGQYGWENVLERAHAGWIGLGPEGDAYSIVLHAMTHAIKPDQPTILAEPIPFFGGRVHGFSGASIIVNLDGKTEKKYFHCLEEGLAERNAAVFAGYKAPKVPHRYAGYRTLAQEHFPDELNNRVLAGLSRNDVPQLIRGILKLNDDQSIKGQHIDYVMSEYSLAGQLTSSVTVLV